ncbi:MAG: PAS domain S-box protein, partial [Caldilineaceae bacterium]|nr:PAS domain S-box protein [Caldilineaceae bacterium]
IKHGRAIGVLCITQSTPRQWTAFDVELAVETAERTWSAVERARAEAQLRESQERLRLALDATEMGTFLYHVAGDRGEPDARMLALFGLPPDGTLNLAEALMHLIHPADRDRYAAAVARATDPAGDGMLHSEIRVLHPDGVVRWVAVTAQVLFDGQPRGATRMYGVAADITERKRREAHQNLLVEIDGDLARLFTPDEIMQTVGARLGAYLNLGICVFVDVDEARDEVTVHHGWNQESVTSLEHQTFRMSDYTTEEFRRASRAGETFVIRDTANDERVDGEANARLNVGAWLGLPFHREGRWTAFLSVTDTAPRDWRDDEIEFLHTIADRIFPRIERARAEAALAASEAKYRMLFNSIDEGFCIIEVIFDANGKAFDLLHLEANEAYERYTGLRNIVGKRAREIVPDGGPWLDFYGNVALTGEAARLEAYLPPGVDRWISSYASRVGGEGSRQVAVVFNDITERKRREAHLAFLAEVSADFAPWASAEELMQRVGVRLARYLNLSRCDFSVVQEEADRITTIYDWRVNDELPSMLGEHQISTFLSAAGRQQYRMGQMTVVNDVRHDPLISAPPELMAQLGIGAVVDAPYVEEGRWTFLLSACRPQAGMWHADEIELLRDLTGRIYIRLERARAEEALRKSEEHLRLATDAAQMYSWELDFKTLATTYSENTERITGLKPPANSAQANALIHPDDRALVERAFAEAIMAQDTFSFEVRAPRTNDQLDWYLVTGVIDRDKEGAPLRAIGVSQNITERKAAEAALRANEARQAIILETMAEGVVSIDPHGRFLSVNAAAERVLGVSRTELVGVSVMEPPFRRFALDGEPWGQRPPLAEVATSGDRVFHNDYVIERRDGSQVIVSRNITALRATDGTLLGFVSTLSDITEQKRIEASLRDSEERFRTVANLLPDLLWSSDPKGATGWYNQRWLEYTGQTLAAAVQQGWLAAVHVDDRVGAYRHLQKTADQGMPLRQELRLRRGDGVYHWFLVQVQSIFDDAGQVVRWFGAATDIHEQRIVRNMLEHHVAERTQELATISATRQHLLDRLITAQEDERRRIARDLHDSLGQHLVALDIGLKTIQMLNGYPADVEARIQALRAMVQQMDTEVERLTVALRPPALDDLGLPDALRRHVHQWTADSDIAIDLHIRGLVGHRLPAEVETAIFRIAQEALTNIRKHARATHVSLLLEQRSGEVQVIVEDNGQGFDVATVQATDGKRTHLGLNGMRERAALIGGHLEVESKPGTGTTLYLHVLLAEDR